jgi:outer membrane protein TolC
MSLIYLFSKLERIIYYFKNPQNFKKNKLYKKIYDVKNFQDYKDRSKIFYINITNWQNVKIWQNIQLIFIINLNFIKLFKQFFLKFYKNIIFYKLLIIFLYFVFFSIIFPFDCGAISLNELIDYAKENNQELIIAKNKLENVKTINQKVWTEFLPNININSSTGNREIKSNFDGNISQNGKFYLKEIQFEQPLFNGFSSLNNLNKGDKIYLIELANYLDKKQHITFELIKLCINNEMLKKNHENLQEIWQNLQNINNIITAKISFNQSTKQELISNKNDILLIELQIKQNQFEISDNLILIKNLCNLADINNLDLKFNFYEITKKILPLNKLIEMVESNHSLRAKYLNYQVEIDESNNKKSSFAPQISLIGNVSSQKNDLYFQGQKNNFKSIAINLRIPIFQKGIEYLDLKDLEQKKHIALKEFEQHKKFLVSEIIRFYNQYIYNNDNDKICDEILNLCQQKIAISKFKIDKKTADLTDLYKNQISYFTQKNICHKYHYESLISLMRIKSLIGDLYV